MRKSFAAPASRLKAAALFLSAVPAALALSAVLAVALFRAPAAAAGGGTFGAETERTEVFVSVTDVVVAHTAMENPVKYTLDPEEAAEGADVKISYLEISSLSDPGRTVSVPKDIGKYIVRIEVGFDSPRYFCAGKYLVYEIAEKQGEPLSGEEAKRSVPSLFRASVENKREVYSLSYEAPKYSFNVASVEPRLEYSHLYANGSTGEYTAALPEEPGDYMASCFVLDTIVGSGRLVIDKLTPEITMEDASFAYDPSGIGPPRASVRPAGIELEYKAYIYKDGAAEESVSFPLRDCGVYLVSAFPADTAHYGFSLSRCRITIEKVRPVILVKGAVSGKNILPAVVCTEDSLPKPLRFSFSPDYAEYLVSYYKFEDGRVSPLDVPPSAAGSYYATVAVKGSDCVISVTEAFGILIEKEKEAPRGTADMALKALCLAAASAALLTGAFQTFAAKRRKGAGDK